MSAPEALNVAGLVAFIVAAVLSIAAFAFGLAVIWTDDPVKLRCGETACVLGSVAGLIWIALVANALVDAA